jgi:hypothetical protein
MFRLMFILPRNSWNDFYSGSPGQTYGTSTNQIKITSGGSAYVFNAIFQYLSTSSVGGAIYCSGVSLLFLSESTSFLNCTSSGKGGAIYLYITGESILYKVCGFGCLAANGPVQFVRNQLSNDVTKRNEFNYTSVCHSIQKADYNCIIYPSYGKVKYNSVNSSQNECLHNSGIDCNSQSGEGCCVIEYCSLTNNTMRNSMVIGLYSSSYGKQIRFCNILNNKQLNIGSYGLIYTLSAVTVESSCILGNAANCQVYDTSSASIVSNCSIDFDSSKLNRATITNSPTKSFIIKIACFETAACEAFYDSYRELSILPGLTKTTNAVMFSCENRRRIWSSNLIFELIVLISFINSD